MLHIRIFDKTACYREHRQVRARSVIYPASGTSLAERAWTDPV